MTVEVPTYLKHPSFPAASIQFTTWIWNKAFNSSPFSALLALGMGKGLMSVKAIALTIPAQVFAEMVLRGKEIGKVRLESIILLKMTLESLWVIHTHEREREKEKASSPWAISTLCEKISLVFIWVLLVSFKNFCFKNIFVNMLKVPWFLSYGYFQLCLLYFFSGKGERPQGPKVPHLYKRTELQQSLFQQDYNGVI